MAHLAKGVHAFAIPSKHHLTAKAVQAQPPPPSSYNKGGINIYSPTDQRHIPIRNGIDPMNLRGTSSVYGFLPACKVKTSIEPSPNEYNLNQIKVTGRRKGRRAYVPERGSKKKVFAILNSNPTDENKKHKKNVRRFFEKDGLLKQLISVKGKTKDELEKIISEAIKSLERDLKKESNEAKAEIILDRIDALKIPAGSPKDALEKALENEALYVDDDIIETGITSKEALDSIEEEEEEGKHDEEEEDDEEEDEGDEGDTDDESDDEEIISEAELLDQSSRLPIMTKLPRKMGLSPSVMSQIKKELKGELIKGLEEEKKELLEGIKKRGEKKLVDAEIKQMTKELKKEKKELLEGIKKRGEKKLVDAEIKQMTKELKKEKKELLEGIKKRADKKKLIKDLEEANPTGPPSSAGLERILELTRSPRKTKISETERKQLFKDLEEEKKELLSGIKKRADKRTAKKQTTIKEEMAQKIAEQKAEKLRKKGRAGIATFKEKPTKKEIEKVESTKKIAEALLKEEQKIPTIKEKKPKIVEKIIKAEPIDHRFASEWKQMTNDELLKILEQAFHSKRGLKEKFNMKKKFIKNIKGNLITTKTAMNNLKRMSEMTLHPDTLQLEIEP